MSQSEDKKEKKPKDPTYTGFLIIVIISTILIIAFFLFTIYKLASTKFSLVGTATSPCKVGECATNLLTGIKRCPSDATTTINYDVNTEVCNTLDKCDNPITPYAVQSDGSTNGSTCTSGVPCACSQFERCGRYVQSAFRLNSGTFYQLPSYNNNNGLISSVPPIYLPKNDTSNTYSCTIKQADITNSIPGCQGSIEDCMNNNASTTGNPCSRGVLAFLLPEGATFDSSDTSSYDLVCAAGPTCEEGQYYVYDQTLEQVVCQ